ncbi:unnamed protein product [Prorocentrum cordatum]|uniref:Uncharacterized protein n=1 Tax=Prorocentrum cordatum TaxID=2364126 RepID=A0ABN9UAU2_9DINO|nr:unnamed protein product [Polarella glacialis]
MRSSWLEIASIKGAMRDSGKFHLHHLDTPSFSSESAEASPMMKPCSKMMGFCGHGATRCLIVQHGQDALAVRLPTAEIREGRENRHLRQERMTNSTGSKNGAVRSTMKDSSTTRSTNISETTNGKSLKMAKHRMTNGSMKTMSPSPW